MNTVSADTDDDATDPSRSRVERKANAIDAERASDVLVAAMLEAFAEDLEKRDGRGIPAEWMREAARRLVN